MTLVADECVADAIIARLRTDGHTVHAVRETFGGAPDPDVLALAVRLEAVPLTQDKDFGELAYRLKRPHHGIALVRLSGVPLDERAELVSQVLAARAGELPDAFTVISRDRVRIRPPGSAP